MCVRGAGTDLNQGGQDPVKEKIGAKPRIFYGTYGTSPTTPLEYFTEHTEPRRLPPSNILRNIRGTSPTTPLEYFTEHTEPRRLPPLEYFTEHTEPHRLPPLEFTRILLKERGKNVEKTWWDNFGKLLGQNKKLQGQLSQ